MNKCFQISVQTNQKQVQQSSVMGSNGGGGGGERGRERRERKKERKEINYLFCYSYKWIILIGSWWELQEDTPHIEHTSIKLIATQSHVNMCICSPETCAHIWENKIQI